ncbi:hypothetical protein MMC07_007170 [Pseudocyphellaria aurata]|nr:hypothetical protein [Pseudocyphellaria aurata]
MEKIKDVTKSGWHPKKESWRGDFKGINQVAGWVGKGKNSQAENQDQEHRSRPLASLKNPDAFGPPPKNLNYHGGAAVPNAITPDRSGLGAPVSVDETRAREEEEQRELDATEESKAGPPIPYRADTTGLSTRNLPKPPLRRNEHGSPPIIGTKPKPSLPPRLPPRQNSDSSQAPFSPPPPYSSDSGATPNAARNDDTTQGALRRLGSAGINVPGLSIGGGTHANKRQDLATPADGDPSSSPSKGQGSQLNELQSRFSKMSTTQPSPGSPSQGTSFADKQAAFKTATAFRNNPSSVSLADARATAATANNFRERHGDQVASGWKSANALNQKYDLSSKVGGYASNSGASQQHEPSPPAATPDTPDPVVHAIKKKAPPPPPKKGLTGGDSAGLPPPIPLSTKPKQ